MSSVAKRSVVFLDGMIILISHSDCVCVQAALVKERRTHSFQLTRVLTLSSSICFRGFSPEKSSMASPYRYLSSSARVLSPGFANVVSQPLAQGSSFGKHQLTSLRRRYSLDAALVLGQICTELISGNFIR